MSNQENISDQVKGAISNSSSSTRENLAEKIKKIDEISHRIWDARGKKYNLPKLEDSYVPSKFTVMLTK